MGGGATKEKNKEINQLEHYQTSQTSLGNVESSPKVFTLKNNSRLSKAFGLLKKQQYKEAIEILDKIIEKHPNLADAQYFKGLAYLGLNNLQQALFYCKAASDLDSQHSQAIAEIGNIYILEKKYQEALSIFQKLVEINNNSFQGNFGIGFINLMLNNFEIADPYFRNALKIKNNDKAALLNYGHLLVKQQNYDQGLVYYQEALKADPKYSDAINAISNLCLHQKKYNQLIEFLDQAVDQNIPRLKSVILNCKSQAYCGLKQFDKSIEIFQQVLEYDPKNIDSLYGLGMCFYNQNQLNKAMVYFNKIIHEKPFDIKTLKIVVKISLNLKLYYQLSDCCDKLIQLGQGDQQIHYYRGVAWMNQKQFSQAIEDFNQTLSFDQNNSIALKNKALCYTQLKDFDQAILCYDMILKQSTVVSEKSDIFYEKGFCHLLAQQFFSAKKNFDSALQLKQKNEDLMLKIANAYRDNKNIQPALNMYDRLIKMKPNNPVVYAEKGALLEQQGSCQEAKQQYDQAITLEGDNSKYYILRARIKTQIQEFDEAIQDLQQAIKLNDQDPEIFFELGQLLYMKQKLDQSIILFSKAINLNENVERYHLKYAQILQMQDSDHEAIEHLKKIIAKHADFQNCKNLLQSLNTNPFSQKEYTNVFVYIMISFFSEVMIDDIHSKDSVRQESIRIIQDNLQNCFPIIENIFEKIQSLVIKKYEFKFINNSKDLRRILVKLYKNKFEQQYQCIMDFIETAKRITKLKENIIKNEDAIIDYQLQETFLQQCSGYNMGQFQSKAAALALEDSVDLIAGILLNFNKLVQSQQSLKNQMYDMIRNGSLSKLRQK